MDASRPSDAQFDPNHFQSRLSTKHSTIHTLTDQALIAFEIEHERNRLREELHRLQQAQDDAQRSLQILEFMSLRMDKDPLVNHSSNNKFKNTNSHNHNPHNHRNHNNHHNHHQKPHQHKTHRYTNFITSDEDISLEYLPSNTIIRCSNKQLRKISDICVGDKILSLCINNYPNGKARKSYLPKPSKRPSQSQSQSSSSNSLSNTNTNTNIKTSPRAGAGTHMDIHLNGTRNLNSLPIRPRSRTTANITVPFMLPPPVHHATATRPADRKPRKSMPMYIAPNLIAQSVTTAVNESLMLTPQGNRSPKSPKTRSKSFVASNTFYKKNKEERKDEHSPFDIERYHQSRSSYSNSGFTQIPGPIPSHYHRNNHRNKNRLSSLPRFNTNKKTKSQNNSPTHSHQNSKGSFPYSAVDLREHSNRERHQKKTRFSNNDTSNLHKRSFSIQRKNGKSNYLESVGVTRVLEKNIYQLIEIVTENDFKIRCTPTHLFWICGKGWGCFDSKRRIVMEKEVAIMSENRTSTVRIPHIIHELKTGEQLLSVGGNKYRIAYINVIDRPHGTRVYGLIVNKNDCFFANDLLVKNCIL